VPLIIAGQVVEEPGREVDELVNSVDLFQLFGDLAGVNVAEVVPPSRLLDSRSLLPYLTNPEAQAIRKTNFTQVAVGTFTPVPSERSWPCQIASTCNDTLFASEGLCLDNGGTWFGPGGAQNASSCCAVADLTGTSLSIVPTKQYALRNKRYKLVELEQTNCQAPLPPNAQNKPYPWAEYETTTVREFYDLKPTTGNPLGLDQPDGNFLKDCPAGQDPVTCLPANLRDTYQKLSNDLEATLDSGKPADMCQKKGDGNLDQWVNKADIEGWKAYNGKGPSRYDINIDAKTDRKDLQIIEANLGTDCLGLCARADLNRDGRVSDKDMAILRASMGLRETCDEVLCNGDLNGDKKMSREDVRLIFEAQQTCNGLN
jgi:hypothetical protein